MVLGTRNFVEPHGSIIKRETSYKEGTMKKVCIVLIAVLLAFSSSMAFADTKVTLGLKSWYNWWTHDRDYASGTTKSWDNGSSFMVGPSLNIKAGKVFFGGSYLQSTSNYEAPDWFAPEDADRMEFERKDLDITAGVMFTPYIGVFVGYKSIDAPMEYTNAASTPTFSSADFGSMTIKGPGFGILGNIPLGQSAALYGNLALLSVEQQFEYPVRTFVSSLGNTRGWRGAGRASGISERGDKCSNGILELLFDTQEGQVAVKRGGLPERDVSKNAEAGAFDCHRPKIRGTECRGRGRVRVFHGGIYLLIADK